MLSIFSLRISDYLKGKFLKTPLGRYLIISAFSFVMRVSL